MKNYTNTIFVLSLVCALVAGTSFFWLLFETRGNIQKSTEALQEAHEGNSKKNHMHVLTSLLNNSETEREKFVELFIDDNKVVDFLQEIEQFGTHTGTVVEVGSIRGEDDRILVTVSLVGSFAQLRNFIELSSNIPRATFIKSARLTKQKKATLWEGDVELVVLKSDI